MGILFSDTQVKDLSLTTLQLPLIIDNPIEGTGLTQQKAQVVTQQTNLFDLDQQNKIFTDHWITVLNDYHTELERLNKVVKTPYDESIIQLGGQILPPHYISSWPNLVPIVIPESTGDPTSTSLVPDELDRVTSINDSVNKLVNGFGGTFETTLLNSYTIGSGQISLFSGTLNPGDIIIIDSGGTSMLALVGVTGGFCTGDTPPGATDEITCVANGGTWTPTTSITPISTDKNFPSGARVKDFHPGFTNAERGQQGAPNYAFDVMIHFQNLMDTDVANWKTNLTDQLNAVSNNGDILPANITLNNISISNINAAIPDIDSWVLIPSISATGRFTDTSLPLITGNVTTRTTQIPNRVTEINNSLGPLTQASDGSVSGSGAYASLFEFVNIRIAKSGGTLSGFFNLDIGIKHFDTKILNAVNQLTQYNNSFAIALIDTDSTTSQFAFNVDSVIEFAIGQTVKVMDNLSIIFTRTITNIVSNTITLDSGIPVVLTVNDIARIIRVK